MNTHAARGRGPSVFERLSTLGDTTRCRLLALLEAHELTVTELCQAVQLPQSTVSRHLKVLGDDGWVAARAEGTSRHYRMAPELEGEALALWSLVRSGLRDTAADAEDRERARSVLDRRVDRSREFFSASADRWDEVRATLYGGRADVLPLFGLIEDGAVVADLGAGTGQLARAVAPFAGRVIAVDRSPEMLAAARRRLQGLDHVEVLEADLAALPLEDGGVDVAFLSLVLHYVVDPPGVLREARRVLRPGGRLVVVDMRAHERAEYRDEMGHLWPGFTPEQMDGWMTGAGFEGCRVRPLPPDAEAQGPLLFLATGRARTTQDHRTDTQPNIEGGPGWRAP